MIKKLSVFFSAFIACAAAAQAEELVVAAPRSVPPYVIAEEDGGIEFQVVKEALAKVGHTVKARMTVLARLPKEMQAGEVDAALTMQPGTGVEACYSDSHVTYQNYAISLEKNDQHIDSAADLRGKSVIAFQNAHIYLGEDYKKAVQDSAGYREEANQVVQALMLFSGRVQAVVADVNIFRWYAGDAAVRGKVDVTQKLRLHPIFPPTPYQVAFRDPKICADFNRGLAVLRSEGRFDRIVAGYIARMESNLAEAR